MNTPGQEWVMSMLGSLYKRTGNLNEALVLFQRSIEESRSREDNLGVLNSLSSLVDLFLYWNIPEYADMYASEAVLLEKIMSNKNQMVSAQTYINKGRALHQLGLTDSIPFYIEHARKICETLPYNSGMVDINLLNGIYLTEKDGDFLSSGIQELQKVVRQGTATNCAKAYHQLAQTYLKNGQVKEAETALDSLYLILNQNDLPAQILHIEYKPILDHYLKTGNQVKVEEYTKLMFQEQKAFKEKSLNYNLVETIVDLQTGHRLQQLKISQLKQANHRLWLLICIGISVIAMTIVVTQLIYQRKKHIKQIRNAGEQVASLVEKLNQANVEKDKISQEVMEFLNDKDKRMEIETLTPYVLKKSGETKFRQCFEMIYPLFLPRLREKVPTVSRREELLSMLIALKQDNKNIAELLAIAPRSVLMLRHRFRQKIGMETELSLENFIEDLLIDKQPGMN
jgi:tetratricopeptide (TPR) repeat protein